MDHEPKQNCLSVEILFWEKNVLLEKLPLVQTNGYKWKFFENVAALHNYTLEISTKPTILALLFIKNNLKEVAMLFDEKQQSIINSLTPKQVEALTELLNEEESVTSVPLATNVDTEAMNAPLAEALWLHQRQVRRCYYFYAKHEYEAWVTLGKDGPRRSVAKIELHIDRERDGAHYTHTCKNTDYCNKTDKVYFTGNACGGRSCVQSTATDEVYGVWSAPHSCID